MLVLSLDSTASTATVALSRDLAPLAEVTLNLGSTHSTTLLPSVKFVLNRAGVSLDDVGLVAVSAGPGSYTGVRIGCATAKGLLVGRDIPCIGVSSLAVLACPHIASGKIVCPVINARSDRYFTALFQSHNGEISRITDDDVLTGDTLTEIIVERGENVILCGDGTDALLAAHPDIPYIAIPATLMSPDAYYVGKLALEIFTGATDEERQKFTASSLQPIYLRRPQAERELLEGKLKIGRQ